MFLNLSKISWLKNSDIVMSLKPVSYWISLKHIILNWKIVKKTSYDVISVISWCGCNVESKNRLYKIIQEKNVIWIRNSKWRQSISYKTYFKNNSCDDQFFYLVASLFWCPIVGISVCSHSVPSEGFNSLPDTQVNTYLLSVFHHYQNSCQNKKGPLMCSNVLLSDFLRIFSINLRKEITLQDRRIKMVGKDKYIIF